MKFVRFILRFLLSLVLAILIVALGLQLTGNGYLVKAVRSTYLVGKTGPSIDDYHKFENKTIPAGTHTKWPKSSQYNRYRLNESEQTIFDKWETVSFLLIRNDSLLFEKYWEPYSEESYSNSFSVAKSLVSLAIGAAIQKGCIESVDQYVSEYLEEFKEGEKNKIKIIDLLEMSSGIDFGESYGDPLGFMAKTYYGDELVDLTFSKEVSNSSGEIWKYQGGNTLILSFILQKACGTTLSEFFSQEIWSKIGTSKNALWTINEEEQEKAYCCFYSNARDYGRIGALVLDSGRWNEEQLIDQSFVNNLYEPVNLPNDTGRVIDYYSKHWWLTDQNGVEIVYARGILGQYIVIIPEWNAIMVRLGHKRDPNVGASVPIDLREYLDIAEEILQ